MTPSGHQRNYTTLTGTIEKMATPRRLECPTYS
jgi:hypothetical protein